MTTTVLLIVIAVSLLAILAALIFVGVTAYRLYKHARRIQEEMDPQMQGILGKQAAAMDLVASIEAKQAMLGNRMQRATASLSRVTYLASQFATATNRLRGY